MCLDPPIDWGDYPNFEKYEFDCHHTGKNEMDARFMRKLQALRTAYAQPMRITSGYRAPEHPIEAAKARPGAHATGQAADIAVGPGADAHDLVRLAMAYGFNGVGVSQRNGRPRFIHLDTLDRLAVWSY